MNKIIKTALYMMAVVAFLTTACNDKDTNIPVDGVIIDPMSMTMIIGDTESLSATVSPENATNPEVHWSSSNRSVATVADGVVTAHAQGEARISVTTIDGSFRTTCIVSVYAEPVAATGVTLDFDELTIERGQTHILKTAMVPENATDKRVTWRSSDYSVVNVTQSGRVEALGVGEATVTVTTRDGNYVASCVVTVTPIIIRPDGVTLNQTSLNFGFAGASALLTATVTPELADNKKLEWSSSDPAVSVTPAGEFIAMVVAEAMGTAVITVTTVDGRLTAVCNVTVSPDNAVNLSPGDDLKAAMENAGNIGKVLRLPPNYVYTTASAINVAGGMQVMGNEGQRAKIISNGGNLFNLFTATPGELEFVNVDIDHQNPANSDAHIFNSGSSVLVSKLSFKNSRIANFGRNMMRVRTDSNIDNIIIENCIFENMGVVGANYGMIHVENNSAVKNIKITNSTFNSMGCHFIHFNASTTNGETITIENCTFYGMFDNSSGRGFINANSVTTGITVVLRNLIMGSSRAGVTNNGLNNPNGATAIDNVYTTTDWVVNNDIPNTTLYAGSAASLFTDPDNGNFGIKDAAFAGKDTAGDPRWR